VDPRDEDRFDRIQLHEQIERARLVIDQYEKGMTFYRRIIEDNRYKLGRLDERLGD
jgi:hypothetical protein